MYLNDDGKALGLAWNLSATLLLAPRLLCDVVVGQVFVAGPVTAGGNHRDVPLSFIEQLGVSS